MSPPHNHSHDERPADMASLSSRPEEYDLRERTARLEFAADHSVTDRRDIWNAVAAMRDQYQGFAGKTDIFLAKAEEVLKRVDDHAASIKKIEASMSEAKGRGSLFVGIWSFASSILGGGLVYFFPKLFGSGH